MTVPGKSFFLSNLGTFFTGFIYSKFIGKNPPLAHNQSPISLPFWECRAELVGSLIGSDILSQQLQDIQCINLATENGYHSEQHITSTL